MPIRNKLNAQSSIRNKLNAQSSIELDKSFRKAISHHKNWQKQKDKRKAFVCANCGYLDSKDTDSKFAFMIGLSKYQCKKNMRTIELDKDIHDEYGNNCRSWISIKDYFKRTEAERVAIKSW